MSYQIQGICRNLYLGIDIGSVSITMVAIDQNKSIVNQRYLFHHGNITKGIRQIFSGITPDQIRKIATTTSTPDILRHDEKFDNRISIIRAAQEFHPHIGSILIVGGEKFGVISFDAKGQYLNYKSNTSCAAGTGSFLDQQAKRLSLQGIEQLSELAYQNQGPIPQIASRCAVFAKTDLIHAQQEGYSLSEICDGLCFGLAKNICDTLFTTHKPLTPMIFTGGVSKNKAVVRHLEQILNTAIITNGTTFYGALGAAISGLESENPYIDVHIESIDDIVVQTQKQKKYHYAPLQLDRSEYPDFSSNEQYRFSPVNLTCAKSHDVEVDIYQPIETNTSLSIYLGFDIGSTSTKAVIINSQKHVLAGFYTRTAGRPITAIQAILEAIDDIMTQKQLQLHVMGCGTTGSGRKFIGKIIGADLILDEITAHARAACEINPNVDTIIEIGGQDSKFTTLKNKMVTFSVMNSVCAAGTGSFIEEQAQKLNCPLSEYTHRTENLRSPIASDRCTVFMERDLNHYLNEGYSTSEVLAAVLHSICENYLTKVAIESNIGDTVFFQGATAKNKALIAAFEQRLDKPIHVSKFCHLTGAMGTAFALCDQDQKDSNFRGIALYKKEIPLKSEVCQLCNNHCKLSVANIKGEIEAYGFLCGRDYDTHKFVNNNLSGFDLIRTRKKIFESTLPTPLTGQTAQKTIGLPYALFMIEDFYFWKSFFSHFPVDIIDSRLFDKGVKQGKKLTGAEFCAPLTALQGHVDYLFDKTDYVFLPIYIEKRTKDRHIRRQYCYYTQYASTLALSMHDGPKIDKLLRPLVNYLYFTFHTKLELYRMMKKVLPGQISFFQVSAAFDQAQLYQEECEKKLKATYYQNMEDNNDVHVVMVGRPYTILSKVMNNNIPDIFASLGVKTFFQDMIDYDSNDIGPIDPLLKSLPWHYAAKIMETAEVIANTRGAYPVLVTSFKCTPDAFVINFFKQLMDSYKKPYLILQLDELDSNVGYETRIEAALRAFRNHYQATESKQETVRYSPSLIFSRPKKLDQKTLLIPNWDDLCLRLIVANMQKEGIDARLLDETEDSIQKSLKYNTGQCLPLNIVAQEFVDYVETHDLDPANSVLWCINSTLSCNLSLYPHQIQNILTNYGHGFENSHVYTGAVSMADISVKLPINSYFAYMFGGLLRKLGCKIRPYEKLSGSTDRVIEQSIEILSQAFRGERSKEDALASVVSRFEKIELDPRQEMGTRPKVAIFGDLYVRDNDIMNQNLIHFIEENGGEVITTPYRDYIKMIAGQYFRKWFIEGDYMSVISSKTFFTTVKYLEKVYYRYFEKLLDYSDLKFDISAEKILEEYYVRIENTGETMDNVLKVHYIKKHYPDVALLVQTSPAFCCPALITESMSGFIEQKTGIPIVSITYDGTGGNKNDAIIPYLKFPRNQQNDKKGTPLEPVNLNLNHR